MLLAFVIVSFLIGRRKKRAQHTYTPSASGGAVAALKAYPRGPNEAFYNGRSAVDFEWKKRDAERRKLQYKDQRADLGMPAIDSPDALWQFLRLRDFRHLVLLCDANGNEFSQEAIGSGADRRLRNYHLRVVPKRSGGHRILAIPKHDLKQAQRKILREILDRVPMHPAARGFRRGKSILDHAAPHVGRQILVAYDLQDYFPSISRKRVRGFFEWLGYPPSVAHLMSLLTTTRDGAGNPARYVRHLPQGAPTSPALANAITYRLDTRLTGLAKKFGATYTRYADDLAFSGDEEFKRGLSRFLPLVQQIISHEHFGVNPYKRRFMRRGRRQNLTGLVVNDRPSLGREEYDRLKAILHNARKAGSLESQNRGKIDYFSDHIRGRIAWVARFHPGKGAKLLAQFERLESGAFLDETPDAPPPE